MRAGGIRGVIAVALLAWATPWASGDEALFMGLGHLPGAEGSHAYGVLADGLVVVGSSGGEAELSDAHKAARAAARDRRSSRG